MNNMREILSRLERYDKVVVYWKDDIVKIVVVAPGEDTNMVIYDSQVDDKDVLELELDNSLVVPCPTVVTDEFMKRVYFSLGERKEDAYILGCSICNYCYHTIDELWQDFKEVFESQDITKEKIIAELIDNLIYEIREGITIYKGTAYPSEFEVSDDRE